MSPPTTVPRLHVLTDAQPGAALLAFVEAVLAAGAPAVQLRCKGRDDRAWLQLAVEVVERCAGAGVVCIVNDRVDIALAAGADGVHIGADDLPVATARELAGTRLLIGATARDPDQAKRAVADGADYLGVGPVYATATKASLPEPIGTEGLASVAAAVDVPVIGIAGITPELAADVLSTGAHGIAVTGAVTRAADPAIATRALLDAIADAIVDGGAR